jgi:hypothetical protein
MRKRALPCISGVLHRDTRRPEKHREEHGETVIVATGATWEECERSLSSGKLWGAFGGVEKLPSALEGV